MTAPRPAFCIVLCAAFLVGLLSALPAAPPAGSGAEAHFWLENAIWHHRYSPAEAAAGLSLPLAEVERRMKEWNVTPESIPAEFARTTLKILPWVPGRHPRLGFLEGAIDPQRDTKVSLFVPSPDGGYAVLDLPEAIFCNLGLIYLAHTHVETIWTKQGIKLEQIDWKRNEDGSLESERKLPNAISFGAKISPMRDGAKFEYWLRNGTAEKLTGLRTQICLMLGRTAEFNAQTKDNKVLFKNAAAAHDATGKKWIVTACESTGRTWQNPPVPCIHADPVSPDCPPGARVSVHGEVFFFEGENPEAEIARRGYAVR